MKREHILKEEDIEILRRIAVVLHQEVGALYRKLAEVRAELARAEGKTQVELEFVVHHLMEQLAERNAELFSTSQSERRGRPEGEPGADESPNEGDSKKKKKKKQTGHGPTPQPNLEVEGVKHELPLEEQKCSQCDGQLTELPDMANKSQQISVKIRTFYILEVRRDLRKERSRPIVEKIHGWLLEQHPPPGLQFDKAVNYSLNRWPALQVFLDHPEVPIDNSSTEQGIRGPVLGRLNFQGVRSPAGARAAGLFYSLIGTCKRQEIDPFAYLVYAARRAMVDPKAVTLPHEYKAHLAQMNVSVDEAAK